MTEQIARLPYGVDICYETFGDPDGAPLLLVMGLGGPMGWWSTDLCSNLTRRGFFVIRYDNRDTGRSSRVPGGRPVVRRHMVSTYLGQRRHAPYSISDLARDAVGLLDHLRIERAHLVGVSMGGMIVQTVAVEHRERVASLTSIMSTTGRRNVGWADPRLLPMLFAPIARTKEAYLARADATSQWLGSRRYRHDPAVMRRMAEETWERGYDADGVLRQLLAVLTQPDRTRALRELDVPACVIHGLADRLVHISGGRATANAIPGAELLLVPDMAHDLPPQLDDTIAAAIERTAARASAQPRHDPRLTPVPGDSSSVVRDLLAAPVHNLATIRHVLVAPVAAPVAVREFVTRRVRSRIGGRVSDQLAESASDTSSASASAR